MIAEQYLKAGNLSEALAQLQADIKLRTFLFQLLSVLGQWERALTQLNENHQDNTIKLARRTEWQELNSKLFIGFGQRLLSTDINDYPLMNVREIEFSKV
jgi:protein involved in temperature-dependent protein secretion